VQLRLDRDAFRAQDAPGARAHPGARAGARDRPPDAWRRRALGGRPAQGLSPSPAARRGEPARHADPRRREHRLQPPEDRGRQRRDERPDAARAGAAGTHPDAVGDRAPDRQHDRARGGRCQCAPRPGKPVLMDRATATVAPFPGNRVRSRAGLVLTGGGARAAYQVGVVKAVRDVLDKPKKNPFPILCGTSAGAINAVTLGVLADDFSRAVANLLEVWENMRCHHIYRTDAWHVIRSGAAWLAAMMLIRRKAPVSLLDNSP